MISCRCAIGTASLTHISLGFGYVAIGAGEFCRIFGRNGLGNARGGVIDGFAEVEVGRMRNDAVGLR